MGLVMSKEIFSMPYLFVGILFCFRDPLSFTFGYLPVIWKPLHKHGIGLDLLTESQLKYIDRCSDQDWENEYYSCF